MSLKPFCQRHKTDLANFADRAALMASATSVTTSPFANRHHQDATAEPRQPDADRDQHHHPPHVRPCFIAPNVQFCCAIRSHNDGASLLNMTAPFIEHSSGMWNPLL